MLSYATFMLVLYVARLTSPTFMLVLYVARLTGAQTKCRSQKEFMEELRSEYTFISDRIMEVMTRIDRKPYILYYPYYIGPELFNWGKVTVIDYPPNMNAVVLELLKDHLQEGNKVLDVGFGSGYLSACMASMVGEKGIVVGVECIKQQADFAFNATLHDKYLQSKNIHVKFVVRDGTRGVPENRPYDAINVAPAAPEVPKELLAQLNVGGRLIIMHGKIGYKKRITIYDKYSEDNITVSEKKGDYWARRVLWNTTFVQ